MKNMEITTVEIPKKKADIYRAMQPGESIEIPEKLRNGYYNSARIAAPAATWATNKVNGKVYLTRVS